MTTDYDIELYNVFEGHDRFAFPEPVYRVTGGYGGEALLIAGSSRTALLDTGMAYCHEKTIANLDDTLARLGRDRLDYILLSHSHYDHVGALPYIREAHPEAEVCAGTRCARVLTRPGARALIKELGERSQQLYAPENTEPVRVDGLVMDRILRDMDRIDLGKETITVYETKGHTDCSLSFMLSPLQLLFTSESTGIVESVNLVHTPVLKDFSQALESMERCRKLSPQLVCLPHFGMLPKDYIDKYWEDFREECYSKFRFVRSMMDEGLTEEQMLDRYVEKYWTPIKAMEQPKEAFVINSGYILKAVLKELAKEEYHGF